MENIQIGVELEGGLADSEGKPLAVRDFLGDGASTGLPFEKVTDDVGASTFELITTPCKNKREVGESLERCRALLPQGMVPIFKTRPFRSEVPIAEKSRSRSLERALAQEHHRGHLGVKTVAQCCATHFHTAVPSIETDEAVLFMNVLNNAAPYARQRVIERFRVENAERHLMIWQGWTRPERIPAPRWFAGIGELKQFVARVPKLIKLHEGEWVFGEGEASRFADGESEGAFWWLSRLRSYGTNEWRPFPSLPPEHVPAIAGEVLEIADAFWDYVARRPGSYQTQGSARDIFRHLSRFDLMPYRALTSAEWWRLYRL